MDFQEERSGAGVVRLANAMRYDQDIRIMVSKPPVRVIPILVSVLRGSSKSHLN